MRFIARKHSSLRITLDPRGMVISGGQRLLKGLNGKFDQGFDVEFVAGMYETKDQRVIDALKSHPRFGITFYSDEKGVVKPNEQELELENEKADYTDKLASTCEFCGKEFVNTGLLAAHHKKCKKNPNI